MGGRRNRNHLRFRVNSFNQPVFSSFFSLFAIYLLSNSFFPSAFPYLGVLLRLDPIFVFDFLRSCYSSCNNFHSILC